MARATAETRVLEHSKIFAAASSRYALKRKCFCLAGLFYLLERARPPERAPLLRDCR